MSLSDVRAKALELAATVEKGKDPLGSNGLGNVSTRTLCELYLEKHSRPNKRASSFRDDKRHIDRYILPALGHLPAAEVRRSDIIPIVEALGLANKKVLANRVRVLIHGIFRFAAERELVETNPCIGVRRYKENARDRVLNEEEIRLLFKTLKDRPVLWSGYYELLLYTGQRPGEVAGMRWDEISGTTWTIPAHRCKNGLQHKVHLARPILELLETLRDEGQKLKQVSRKSEKTNYDLYVFPSRYGSALSWCNYNARALVREMNVPRWTPHDLRRTMATHLEEHGVASDVIDRMQNHKKQGVTATYQRGHRVRECCQAWELWAELLAGFKGEPPRNVIEIFPRLAAA